MELKHSNYLGIALRDFFTDYLLQLRGMSSNTVFSYRDSLKLFLQFLAEKKKTSVSNLDIEDMEVQNVIDFLNHLEINRKSNTGTRNIRLAAIHIFFRYIAGKHPEYLDKSQRILSIPFKRTSTRTIEYFEFEEITSILKTVDRTTIYGLRDYALISLMFNTGARVGELTALRINDLCLTKPFSVLLHGKGKKERICPIWSQTASVLREHIKEQSIKPIELMAVFTNHLGKPLTRFGVRYVLSKYLSLAADIQPSLKKKHLHPHSMRHSTAIYLLKSGIDICTISHWLGHASINTTNKYATIDLEMKRKVIEKVKPLGTEPNKAIWKSKPDILRWLESL